MQDAAAPKPEPVPDDLLHRVEALLGDLRDEPFPAAPPAPAAESADAAAEPGVGQQEP